MQKPLNFQRGSWTKNNQGQDGENEQNCTSSMGSFWNSKWEVSGEPKDPLKGLVKGYLDSNPKTTPPYQNRLIFVGENQHLPPTPGNVWGILSLMAIWLLRVILRSSTLLRSLKAMEGQGQKHAKNQLELKWKWITFVSPNSQCMAYLPLFTYICARVETPIISI